MSVNYAQPHAVDVPITDMDDLEDDLFNDPVDKNHNDFLDSLDFEHEEAGIFNKVSNSFAKIFKKATRSNNYEMIDRSLPIDQRSYHDSEDGGNERDDNRGFDIRDYKIKLLTNKFKRVLVVGIVIVISLASVIIYLSTRIGRQTFVGVSSSLKKTISNSTHDFHPTTIVISLDGFHPHYIDPHTTPTLHNMLLNDFGAPYMIPSFPSSTFPNHWTLITGLYPSEHGIVGNTFYDIKLKKQFINTNPKVGGLDPDFWRGGEPVWTTAKNQGVNAALHMWPGSEVPGIGPSHDFDKYNGSELLSSKVQKVMKWLDRGDITKRPELILTYVPTIDSVGHKIGIYGPELTESLKYVDDFIELMQRELKQRNLENIVNLIILSDHGMAPTSNERLLYLDDIIDLNKIEHVDGWPLFGLRPSSQFTTEDILSELQTNFQGLDEGVNKHFRIFKVEDLPKEWHFGGQLNEHKFNYRLAPIWVIPDVGYSITTKKQMTENGNEYKPKGVHGYNNTELLMRALFLGSGPYFNQRLKSGKKVLPFPNTEVYNMICDSLDLVPAPNNGTDVAHDAAISSLRELPSDWTDPLEYPNLPFKVEHIVNGATYDLLWKPKKVADSPTTISVSTNNHPLSSLIVQESSLPSVGSVHLPKPTDFIDDNDQSQDHFDDVADDAELNGILSDILGTIGGIFDDVTVTVGQTINGTIHNVGDWVHSITKGKPGVQVNSI